MNERINEKKSEQALQAWSNPKKHGDRWKKEKTEWKSNKWRGNHNSDKDHKKGRGSNSQNSSNRKKFDKRSIQCFNYQKFGHFADECYRKPNNKREPKGNDAKLAQEENEDIEQVLLMVTTQIEGESDNCNDPPCRYDITTLIIGKLNSFSFFYENSIILLIKNHSKFEFY